ncbi:MAG: translation initiation factor eIF-2B [Candidatus Absconditicoccaceae bacterium]
MQDLSTIQKIVDDIKSITIQGATNIAKAAFEILISESKEKSFESGSAFLDFIQQGMELLISARPTEPMLFNGMDYIKAEISKLAPSASADECQQKVAEAAQFYLNLINETAERAVLNGLGIINDGDNVLTHCHSSSAVKTLKLHKVKGLKFKVYNTETRPLFQGRKTAKDLIEAGIDTTMVVDGVAPFLMDEESGTDLMMDCVIIGCDAIKLDGGVINKVGSYSVGLSALFANVPVYIAGNLLKVDIHDKIHIEKRQDHEVWEDSPEGLQFLNLAFDKIPPKFIRGIITEFGIIKPRDIRAVVEREYPWMKIA